MTILTACLPSDAVSGEINTKDGLAISGYDPVGYFREGRPVPGLSSLTVVHGEATYRFASEANREAFRADPEAYLPQYGGYCAFGTAQGYKAPIDPAAFTVVGDKLYLNYDSGVQTTWRKDRDDFIRKADQNWPTVRTQ